MSVVSQLSPASIARIESAPMGQRGSWRYERVQIFDLPEGPVIVKGHREPHGQWRYQTLNAIAFMMDAPYLRAVPVHGGERSQAIELARLAALKAAGVPVPEVMHVATDYFVMRYLGRECLGSLINAGHPDAANLWREVCACMRTAHAAGQYLSQSFGRNVIVTQRVMGFIDFEDDPLEIFSLQQAQVRDWLLFLHSTLGMLQVPRAQLELMLAQELAAEREDIRAELRKLALSIGWLRHLPANPKTLGRDVYRAQSAASFLYQWAQRDNQP